MSYTDAHCHLSDPRFSAHLSEIISRSREAQVNRWILGGVSKADWLRQIELKAEFGSQVLLSFGIHPWATDEMNLVELEAMISENRKILSALGETGIDKSARIDPSTYPKQIEVFKEQLLLARRFSLPLILHIVNAHDEALEILEQQGPHPQGGIVHSFSSSLEIAKRYLKLGHTLSIGTSVTRKGFETLKRAMIALNDNDFVVESDSPDQPISEDREAGRLNEPARIWAVAEAIAKIRGVQDASAILKQSEKNLERIFNS